jgi:hypothetical protein
VVDKPRKINHTNPGIIVSQPTSSELDNAFVDEFERELVSYEAEYKRKLRQGWAACLATTVALACVFALINTLVRFEGLLALALMLPMLGLVCIASSALIQAEEFKKKAGAMLSAVNDPRLIGMLLRRLGHGWRPRQATLQGLKRTLSGVRPQHARRIDDSSMSGLIGLLANPADVEMTLVVLSALEQIGDSRAIPAVRRLTFPHEWPVGPYRSPQHMDRIIEAARQCLPSLELRAEAENRGATLLRPADARPESLLRPASDNASNEQELLRATDTECSVQSSVTKDSR